MFCWIHRYFKKYIEQSKAIGLDCIFRVLKPYKACIPQCIVQNTGVPLRIAVGPQESSSLYSLIFELFYLIDEKVYSMFTDLPFISDEHPSFDKLSDDYKIKIYKCFSHLIKSVGANSALGLLFRDILYSYSEHEYEATYLKNCYLFKKLCSMEDEKKRDDTRYYKVGSVFGIDPNGNPIDKKASYSPLYERIIQKVPTTNNHRESYHARINSIAADMRYSINNRLSLVVDHIMSRLTHLDASSIANLRRYMSELKKLVKEKVEKNPELLPKYCLEKCYRKCLSYYSMLYDIDLPCIHMILNDRWNSDISEFLIHLSVDGVDDDYDEDLGLLDYEIPDPNPDEEEFDEDANEIVLHEI